MEAQLEGAETCLAVSQCRPIVGLLDVGKLSLAHTDDVRNLLSRETFLQHEIFQHLHVFLVLVFVHA